MIIACTECHARYVVPATTFSRGPRKVKCVQCGMVWQADIPADVMAALSAMTTETPPSEDLPVNKPPLQKTERIAFLERFRIKMRSLNWPGIWQVVILGTAVFLLITLLILVFARQTLATEWPFLEPIYDTFGLTIPHPNDGLRLRHIHSERHFDGGGTTLTVQGEIRNDSALPKDIPALLVLGMGSDGKILQDWRIDPPLHTLEPQSSIPFHFSTDTPKEGVVNLNFDFEVPKESAPP